MKKRFFVIALAFVMSIILSACSDILKTEIEPNTLENDNEAENNLEKDVVEDEINLDFSTEDDTQDASPDSVEGDAGETTLEDKNNLQDSTDNITDFPENNTSKQTEDNIEVENEQEQNSITPSNPYDKDGDGFLDWWY